MSNKIFTFDGLPDNALDVQAGKHKLTILEVKQVVATQTGSDMLQFTYALDDSKMKLNFDNAPYATKEGEPINFGLSKIKKIMEATHTIPKEGFTIKMLAKLLIGKSFYAEIEMNDKGYPQMSSKLNSILPLEIGEKAAADVSPNDFVKTEETASTEDFAADVSDSDFLNDEE